ncbi:MAG TPA: MaoC family dehydratase N-terminal domain-containing protein [Pseudonocardiaceae bacterium]|nr:MaoC family dehydratase N-terminal domain-containing protein [Pseudonocardiaceae bacterium]
MALDQSVIGRSYPPTQPYAVSAAKIKEFADAIGDRNPRYREAKAIAPPTFGMVINIPAISLIVDDPELGLDYTRLVHADQAFTQHRPITVGDQLVLTAHLDGAMTRAGNDIVTMRSEITTVDGEAVSTTTATLVFRGESA